MSDDEDRTSAPSPRRIQMARSMGFLPMATMLVQSAGLIGSIGLVYLRGPALASGLRQTIVRTWANLPAIAHNETSARTIQAQLVTTLTPLAEPLLTVMLGSLVIMLVVHQWTTGGAWTPELALPNFGRLWNLALFAEEGTSRKPPLSHRLLLGTLRPLAIVAGCGLVVLVLRSRWTPTPTADDPTHETLRGVLRHGRVSIGLGLTMLTIPLLLLGMLEYALNRVRWFDRLRPTDEQARRELRETDGDVEWKKRRQKLVRQIRQKATIDGLVAETAVVVVGSGFTGLSVQLVRSRGGRLAVGQVLRGTIAAGFAEKAAAQGRPWIREGKLASRLVGLAGKPNEPPAELPVVLDLEIQRRIARDSAGSSKPTKT